MHITVTVDKTGHKATTYTGHAFKALLDIRDERVDSISSVRHENTLLLHRGGANGNFISTNGVKLSLSNFTRPTITGHISRSIKFELTDQYFDGVYDICEFTELPQS
jgi:hypothetical protein